MMDNQLAITKFDFNSVGIGPIGFDYSKIEAVFKKRAKAMVEPHRHDYYEILWFTNCSGTHFVDFAGYPFEPNTLFFIAKNQIHYYENKTDIKGHMLRFDEHFVQKYSGGFISFMGYSVFSVTSSPRRLIPKLELPAFTTLIEMTLEETSNSSNHCHCEMLVLLLRLFLLKAERLGPDIESSSFEFRSGMPQFYDFIALVEANYRKHLKVQDYARLLKISGRRLSEICKLISGLAPKEIIQARVILEAKRFLCHSALSVKEICYFLGFDDPANFTKYFHAATSLSPSLFRKSMSDVYK